MERHYSAKGEIGWGHQIRSYVYMPYQLVKDLRTDFETGNVSAVIDGDLDGFMHAYLSWAVSKKKGEKK
jgi:peptide chain release factor 2